MKDDELKSLQKSSVHFKSLNGIKCDELMLSDEDMKWWLDAKVGMFFHWGLYSILGQGEWARHNEKINKEEYEALAWEFNPKDFKMKALVQLAESLNAKYMVMVARHHDGFALWDSPGSYENFTSFATASKRDFVKEYTDACREARLKVGIYYSPMDWRFPGYFDPKGQYENALIMKEQCYRQVEELCGKYGKIDILWYDGGWLAHSGSDADAAWFWEPVKLNKAAKAYNELMLLNPRSGLCGDFQCDEGTHKITGEIINIPWEKNMSITSGWSWMNDDYVMDYDEIIKMIADVVCRGGNILLNVGPDKDGKLPKTVTDTIKKVGDWLRKNSESIYGTRAGILEPVDGVYGTTYNESYVYLHILDLERFKNMVLPLRDVHIDECSSITGELYEFSQTDEGIVIGIPDMAMNEPDVIVRLRINKY